MYVLLNVMLSTLKTVHSPKCFYYYSTTQTILTNNCCTCLIYRIYMYIFIYCECYNHKMCTSQQALQYRAISILCIIHTNMYKLITYDLQPVQLLNCWH